MGKIINIFVILGIISLISCNKCKKPTEGENGWERNPNLRFLVSEWDTVWNSQTNLVDPCWGADGKIYYVSQASGLCVIREDGTNRRKISNFQPRSMDISPDGSMLILNNQGCLTLLDTSGLIIDTIYIGQFYIGNVRWGIDWIYFSQWPGNTYWIKRIKIDGTQEEFIFESPCAQIFAVYKDSLLLTEVPGYGVVINLLTGERIYLSKGAGYDPEFFSPGVYITPVQKEILPPLI